MAVPIIAPKAASVPNALSTISRAMPGSASTLSAITTAATSR